MKIKLISFLFCSTASKWERGVSPAALFAILSVMLFLNSGAITSNSLIDLVVFGRAAAIKAGEIVDAKAANPTLNQASIDAALDRFDGLRNASGAVPTAELRHEMQ